MNQEQNEVIRKLSIAEASLDVVSKVTHKMETDQVIESLVVAKIVPVFRRWILFHCSNYQLQGKQ